MGDHESLLVFDHDPRLPLVLKHAETWHTLEAMLGVSGLKRSTQHAPFRGILVRSVVLVGHTFDE